MPVESEQPIIRLLLQLLFGVRQDSPKCLACQIEIDGSSRDTLKCRRKCHEARFESNSEPSCIIFFCCFGVPGFVACLVAFLVIGHAQKFWQEVCSYNGVDRSKCIIGGDSYCCHHGNRSCYSRGPDACKASFVSTSQSTWGLFFSYIFGIMSLTLILLGLVRLAFAYKLSRRMSWLYRGCPHGGCKWSQEQTSDEPEHTRSNGTKTVPARSGGKCAWCGKMIPLSCSMLSCGECNKSVCHNCASKLTCCNCALKTESPPSQGCDACRGQNPEEWTTRENTEVKRQEQEAKIKRRTSFWAVWPGAQVMPGQDDEDVEDIGDIETGRICSDQQPCEGSYICDSEYRHVEEFAQHVQAEQQETDFSSSQLVEKMVAEYKANEGPGPLTEQEYRQVLNSIQGTVEQSPGGGKHEKFVGKAEELVCGEFEHAAKGLFKLLNINEDIVSHQARAGVAAIEKEVQALGDKNVAEQLDYILWQKATEKKFPNGIRDKGHAGMCLEDFVKHKHAVAAELQEAEVVALRLYTTSAFEKINKPLRDQDRICNGRPHPLPVTVMFITRGIRKLRSIEAHSADAVKSMVLWRGMRNVKPTDHFAEMGGTELAPMSTSTDIHTAVSYSISNDSLLFKILTRNRLQRGADVQWLSAFPTEAEILYPPLTYLQPTGRSQVIRISNHSFTIVEVVSTLG